MRNLLSSVQSTRCIDLIPHLSTTQAAVMTAFFLAGCGFFLHSFLRDSEPQAIYTGTEQYFSTNPIPEIQSLEIKLHSAISGTEHAPTGTANVLAAKVQDANAHMAPLIWHKKTHLDTTKVQSVNRTYSCVHSFAEQSVNGTTYMFFSYSGLHCCFVDVYDAENLQSLFKQYIHI